MHIRGGWVVVGSVTFTEAALGKPTGLLQTPYVLKVKLEAYSKLPVALALIPVTLALKPVVGQHLLLQQLRGQCDIHSTRSLRYLDCQGTHLSTNLSGEEEYLK